MNERKITEAKLDRGPLRAELDHQMHRSGLTEQGRDRVNDAMKAAIDHVASKRGLQYGVSGRHIDNALHFLDTRYEDRRSLKPKEREFIESTLKSHFGIADEVPEPAPEKEAA